MLIQQAVIAASVFGVGVVLKRHVPHWRERLFQLLSYALLPVLLITVLLHVQLSPAVVAAVPFVLATQIVIAAVSVLLLRSPPHAGPVRASALLVAAFSNTAFLGLPLVLTVLPQNQQAAATAIAIDIGTTALFLWTGGFVAAAWLSLDRQADGASDAVLPLTTRLRRALLKPIPLVVVFGVVLRLVIEGVGLTVPPFVHAAVPLVARIVSLTVLLFLGLNFDWRSLRQHWRVAALASALKLLLLPLGVWLLLRWVSLPVTVATVAVLQAAMPTALVTVVVAKEARAAVDVAVAGVVLSTLLAFVTLPLWLWLLLPLP